MNHSRRRLATIGGLALAAALAFTACSPSGGGSGETEGAGDGELTPVKLQLQWLPQGQFAGYFAAQELGYFEEEGLEVEIIPSGGDIVPQDALANGDVDYAIAWVPKVLGSIEQGANLTEIAQIFQRSGTLQVSWADSGIDSVADFEGKKIGSWGFGNEWEIFAAMADEGLDATTVQIITQDFNMNAFLQGDIDAAQAMTYNEYAQLLETVEPRHGRALPARGLQRHQLRGHRGRHAPGRDLGRHRAARERRGVPGHDGQVPEGRRSRGGSTPPRTPRRLSEITIAAGSGWGPSHELWMVNETNKLIWPSPDGIGVIDEAALDQTVAGALAAVNESGAHLITEEPPATAYDERLDPAGARRARGRGARPHRRGLGAHRRHPRGGRQLIMSAG